MKTIKIKLYQFDELNKEAQQKAIEKYRETNEIFLDWFKDDMTETLQEQNIELTKLTYSLNYCQGDGLSFAASFNVNHFVNLCFKDLSQKRRDLFSYFIYKIESKENRGHYSYATASQINIDVNYNSFYYKKHTNINNMLETFEVFMQDYYLGLCSKFESQGYGEIEYQNSDEYISETLRCNGYDFEENGDIY